MRNIGLTALFMTSWIPATIACAEAADKGQADSSTPKVEAVLSAVKGGEEETVQSPEQTVDSILMTQVKLVSGIMVDLQAVIEDSETSANPAKLYKAIGTFQKALVNVQNLFLEFDDSADPMTLAIAKVKLSTQVSDLYFELNELSKTLGANEENTALIEAIRSKIASLRETLQ